MKECCFEALEKVLDRNWLDLADIRFLPCFRSVHFARSHEELSYKLLSEARTKREGYDFQATRRALLGSVTARCPTTTPYDWQIDVAEALIPPNATHGGERGLDEGGVLSGERG